MDGAIFSLDGLREMRFAPCANAHLSDDETVAKMGHPVLWLVLDVGHPPNVQARFFYFRFGN